MSIPTISIVIAAYNAGSQIERCLRGLPDPDVAGVEIIVVDDASTDDTARLASAGGARVVRLERNSGPSAARNRGASLAVGEILFFVDADVVLHEGAVVRVREVMRAQPALAAVFGSYDATPAASGTVTRYRNLLHHHVHQAGDAEASTFWAGCGAVRRRIFLEVGGFDELRFPRCIEDIELGYRLRAAGHPIRLDHQLHCTHLKRWTLSTLVKTDIWCRAIPWSKLDMEQGGSRHHLNIRHSQRISVALIGVALLCLPLVLVSGWFAWLATVTLLATLLLNGRLYRFLARRGGFWFGLRCVPLHLLYFIYSGASYLAVWGTRRLGRSLRDWNGSS